MIDYVSLVYHVATQKQHAQTMRKIVKEDSNSLSGGCFIGCE